MIILAEFKDDQGNVVALVPAAAKVFKTGSSGFYGISKAEFAGKKYQIQVQLVEIGSKPKKETEK
jgi:hypothetical protein